MQRSVQHSILLRHQSLSCFLSLSVCLFLWLFLWPFICSFVCVFIFVFLFLFIHSFLSFWMYICSECDILSFYFIFIFPSPFRRVSYFERSNERTPKGFSSHAKHRLCHRSFRLINKYEHNPIFCDLGSFFLKQTKKSRTCLKNTS
jgi:hypothetical protein